MINMLWVTDETVVKNMLKILVFSRFGVKELLEVVKWKWGWTGCLRASLSIWKITSNSCYMRTVVNIVYTIDLQI